MAMKPKERSAVTQVPVTMDIKGVAPLSWSRPLNDGLRESETHDGFEGRIWRDRFNSREDGQVFIPQMGVKLAMEAAAKHSGKKTQGQATWTKHFMKGVIAVDGGNLTVDGSPIMRDDLKSEELFVPSDGQKGGGRRVHKTFPTILPPWETSFDLIVVDAKITPEILLEMAQIAGNLIGLGRFRPESGGFYGRFVVTRLLWDGRAIG